MKVFITGGAGFIGSSLSEKFVAEGISVVAIDNFNDYYDPKIKEKNISSLIKNPLYQIVRGDILDKALLTSLFDKNHFDFVIHLAARAGVRPSLEDPIAYQKTNGEGTVNVLECAKNAGIHNLVLASSSSVYGNNQKVPFAETDCVDFAISPYAATKKANEVMAHVYHAVFGLNIILLRFFTVYGPRQRPDLAINKFVTYIEQGKELPVYGDGKTFRDYTYIDDICSGIRASMEYLETHSNVYEIINLGSNHPITLNEMVRTIEDCLGKKAIIKHFPMQPGDVNGTYADISKAKAMLAYSPKTSFSEGIRHFVEWKDSIKH
ncbi:MAG: dTDP-glucose 4,6-dehydratase [bacterium ADurb.BinA186]|jgi:UDP-glucuronate 4-epimerase|nr:MAG: dTDP-glucose 4,6-dehydratase [bacterium ADurb.BinA186]